MTHLTAKQELFCLEYLKDLNATQAAIRAGYSEKTANRIATENLSKPVLTARIAKLMEDRRKSVQIDANYVLKRLHEIDTLDVADIMNDVGDLKPLKDWPKAWRTTISAIDVLAINASEKTPASVLKKIKWPDKVKNLELLGKHIAVGAFREMQQVQSQNENISISLTSDMSAEQSAEAYKKLMK